MTPAPVRRTWVRVGALVAALVVTSLALGGLARAIGLPDGYNGAQSKSATELALHRHDWASWKRAATRDMYIFVPVDLAAGSGVIGLLLRLNRSGRGRPPTRAIFLALVGAGVADGAETALFRRTLEGLGGGEPAASLLTATRVTLVLTCLKWVLAVLTVVLLAKRILSSAPTSGDAAPLSATP